MKRVRVCGVVKGFVNKLKTGWVSKKQTQGYWLEGGIVILFEYSFTESSTVELYLNILYY